MPAITVENVSKRYRKGQLGYRTLREDLYNLTGQLIHLRRGNRRSYDERYMWALRDVSFQVEKGEKLGIIGANGSGKTTLLRLLAGITKPTEGRISLKGRIGVLIEIMAGFHPELTGRENIYLNGAIMGMSRKEIKRRFDEIISFAEVEDWVDTPIKRYSSGMHVRLGFAVAAHLDPEILLIDEVLAVGDASFQKKCLGKMDEAAGEGRTVVFVSHNMVSVRSLCERGILLSNGLVIFDGTAADAVDAYMSTVPVVHNRTVVFDDDPEKPIVIQQVSVLSPGKGNAEKLDISEPLVIEIRYKVRQDIRGMNISFALSRDGVVLFRSWDTDRRQELLEMRKAGEYVARIPLPRGLLAPGLYSIYIAAGRLGVGAIVQHNDCLAFELESYRQDIRHLSYSRGGALIMDLEWETMKLTEQPVIVPENDDI